MSEVSLNGQLASIQRGVFKANDTTSAAAKTAEAAMEKSRDAVDDDRLGRHVDVKA